MSEDWSARTRLVHGGARRSQYGETSEAIFLTQGFVYPDAETAEARFIASGPDEFIYARYGNPTVRMFEERMAALEGAEDAFATASGMAAVHGALFASSRPATTWSRRGRSSAPASTSSRRCCRASASRSASSTAPTSTSGAAAIRPDTRLVFLESISNPTLEVIDIAGVAGLAHAVGAQVIADNVFATPVFQRCLPLGADVVIYSATKHIDGQGRCLGGIVLGAPRLHPRPARDLPQAHRRRAQPVQRLGDAEGPRDARPALPRPGGDRAAARRGAAAAIRRSTG